MEMCKEVGGRTFNMGLNTPYPEISHILTYSESEIKRNETLIYFGNVAKVTHLIHRLLSMPSVAGACSATIARPLLPGSDSNW